MPLIGFLFISSDYYFFFRCRTDYVDISTITITGNKFLVGRFCGAKIPESMLFMNPHAEIIFRTNHVLHGQGFHGSYLFQDESELNF